MTTFIYKDKNIRCRVNKIFNSNKIKLQIQKRYLFIFWENAYKYIEISEGFWGESERNPILKLEYFGEGESEIYMTGTLSLENRVHQLFQEYFAYVKRESDTKNRIKYQFELLNK